MSYTHFTNCVSGQSIQFNKPQPDPQIEETKVEARGSVFTSKGGSVEVKSGRMLLVLGEPSYFGDAYDIDLILMIKTSRLLNSFPDPLPTFGRISLAIYAQQLKLKGKYNALIGDAPTKDNLQMWQFGPSEDENNKGFFNKIFKRN